MLNYKQLYCPYCKTPHIDEDKPARVVHNGVTLNRLVNFGKTPHRQHTCSSCKLTFPDPNDEKSIGVSEA